MPSAQAQRNGRIVHQSRARLLTKHRSLWLTELIGFTSGIVESQIAGSVIVFRRPSGCHPGYRLGEKRTWMSAIHLSMTLWVEGGEGGRNE